MVSGIQCAVRGASANRIAPPAFFGLETLAMFSGVQPPSLTQGASGGVFQSPNRLPIVVSLLPRLGRPGQRHRSGGRKQPRTVYVIHNAFDPLTYYVEPDG